MSVSPRSSRYGWIPDIPDRRDRVYRLPAHVVLPSKVDLREQYSVRVYDQGTLGSCTANAITFAIELNSLKQKTSLFIASRLFVYFNERLAMGTIMSDSGAMLRDGIKAVAKYGVCVEENWPYSDLNQGMFMATPPQQIYDEAEKHKITAYQRIYRSLPLMKACLAAGFPFVFGFSVYDSFESNEVAQTGVLQMPSDDESLLGGHAVAAVGYDDATQRLIVRNSWGLAWGDQGHFTMPYEYVTDPNLSDDFWSIQASIS